MYLSTERLIVRSFRRGDLEPMHKLLSDTEVMRYIEPPYSLEQTERFLNETALREPPVLFAVEEKAAGFIGYVIYHPYDADSFELGRILMKEFWHRGYADELTKALMADAAQNQYRLVIECAPEQTVSKHIALKNGFSYTGSENGLDIYRLKP